ncbi:MAG: hypothetical protein AVDCRST_MAG93-9691 [uncultured Chloroflexia bacterium]|uniref:Uncharacterized protein n=1 Tax=uncultured Chloroflexia bacterium TaxID=1672391 RepID=A0A6J4NRE6_9CHLR|nr:MAG: hypothetical protein AVDCRST_MAG93-9691 [uncultured Chloroflexia bacterium]
MLVDRSFCTEKMESLHLVAFSQSALFWLRHWGTAVGTNVAESL